uniref:Bromo domain-containing protein n=1 Tax=Timspurckia oligopyrenoides TaxID=708627 RepID=A0A7S0ZG98_9RHOD|mmetsp:Transcript_4084/g.7178  ORF Transcript_4084/g.7178 Transcript_4084/m.7178 type:complete len:534 (+) Transcript_4084:45-1646(+)
MEVDQSNIRASGSTRSNRTATRNSLQDDVQRQVELLDAERAKILQELAEIDTGKSLQESTSMSLLPSVVEIDHNGTKSTVSQPHLTKSSTKDLTSVLLDSVTPSKTLNQLLLDVDKQVREAKAYADPAAAAAHGIIKVVRVIKGQSAPKSAKLLCKVSGTGVDFTVPVAAPDYTAVVSNPICLNEMREKMKQEMYSSSKEYVDDMKLLLANTRKYNRGAEVDWICQHAELLLEAALECIEVLKPYLEAAEAREKDIIRVTPVKADKESNSVSKDESKMAHRTSSRIARASNSSKVEIELPAVDSHVLVFSEESKVWRRARVMKFSRDKKQAQVLLEDHSTEWVLMDSSNWKSIAAPQLPSSPSYTPSSTLAPSGTPKRRRISDHLAGGATNSTKDARALGSDVNDVVLNRIEDTRLGILEELRFSVDHLQRSILQNGGNSENAMVLEQNIDEIVNRAVDKVESRFRNIVENMKHEMNSSLERICEEIVTKTSHVVAERMELVLGKRLSSSFDGIHGEKEKENETGMIIESPET